VLSCCCVVHCLILCWLWWLVNRLNCPMCALSQM
jgi:hypothetical protein